MAKARREDVGMTLWQRIKRDKWLLLIFLPGILNVLVFKYVPMAGLVTAFQEYKPLLGLAKSPWVGMQQFDRLFQSSQFWQILWNTITLNVETLVFTFPVPILFALLLNEAKGRRFKKITQTVSYLPHFITIVIIAGMVKLFLSPSSGFISRGIGSMLGIDPPFLLTMPEASHTILIVTGLWQGFGWSTIIYLSSLAGVDPQLYEAATIDGASRFQKVLHVTMPALAPVVSIQLIMAVGGLMGSSFDLPFLLQNGLNLSTMETIATYVYKMGIGKGTGMYSFSTAIGMFQSVVNLVLLVGANWISRKVSETSFF